MPLNVPPAKNYASPLIAVPTRYAETPPEGAQMIPCEVDWGTMGGPNNCVFFNLQNNAVMNFSQMVALSVDNSACGADIVFIFPDTTETLAIPAYSPKVICEIFTNQTQFYLSAPNAASEDITRFSIQNTLPPPIAVPTSQEQTTAAAGAEYSETGITEIVAPGISGTIESLSVYGYSAGTSNATLVFDIEDGSTPPVKVFQGTTVSSANIFTFPIVELSDLRVRFQNGLKINVTSLTGNGVGLVANVYYRTP